jgi:hypothetical protein
MRLAFGLAATLQVVACGDPPSPVASSTSGVPSETSSFAATEAPEAATTDAAVSVDTSSGGPPLACDAMFGAPNEATGLTPEQCRPACPCDGWVAPTYDDDDVAALRAAVLTMPYDALVDDPYAMPKAYDGATPGVCAVVGDTRGYTLRTFADEAAATAEGARVTHADGCGVCSTLQDLAVYMANPDLTEPVRACGVLGLSQGDDANLACLLELGFTMPCAQIWLFNTIHTREVCFDACIAALDDPYRLPDGALNPCLQCDEDLSGPVFKAVAGRTRRNTGLPNALCRPCDTVAHVVHDYG